jgi:hypothetical protein
VKDEAEAREAIELRKQVDELDEQGRADLMLQALRKHYEPIGKSVLVGDLAPLPASTP